MTNPSNLTTKNFPFTFWEPNLNYPPNNHSVINHLVPLAINKIYIHFWVTHFNTSPTQIELLAQPINWSPLTLLLLLWNKLLVCLVRTKHHIFPHMDLVVGTFARTGRGRAEHRVASGRYFRRCWLRRRFIVLYVQTVCASAFSHSVHTGSKTWPVN